MSLEQHFQFKCNEILPAMDPANPNHKDQAGNLFFEFVKKLLGAEKAPKITGMLIDLQLSDIRQMMSDW